MLQILISYEQTLYDCAIQTSKYWHQPYIREWQYASKKVNFINYIYDFKGCLIELAPFFSNSR